MTFSPESGGKYLVFQLVQRYFALEMDAIRRVVNAETIYSVPLAKKNYAGLMRFEERAIPIFNLREALGLKKKGEAEENLVAVEQIDDDEVGVLVGSVYSVADLGEGKEIDREPELAGVEKLVEWGGKEVNVVDMGGMLRDCNQDS